MAQQAPVFSPSLHVLHGLGILWLLLLHATLASFAIAQPPLQQYVFGSVPITTTTSQVAAYAKNGQIGALSAVPGLPFADSLQGGAVAVDALGRFLFVVNTATSNISMFQIDQSTGRLAEVPGSPFSTGPTETSMAAKSPVCLAVEKSGQFLYVGYQFGNFPNQGAINEYLIDAANRQFVPLSAQPTSDMASAPIGMVTDPRSVHLYVGLGLKPSTGIQHAGTNVYSINPTVVNVATTANTLAPPSPRVPRVPPLIWLYLFSLLACCAVLVLYASRMRRSSPTEGSLRAAAIAIVASLCIFEAAGCGGGATGVSPQAIPTPPHPTGTPQGTSTITLTPSTTTSTGTPLPGVPPIQLTLTVQ